MTPFPHLQMTNPVQFSTAFVSVPLHTGPLSPDLLVMGPVGQMLLLEEEDCQDLGQAPQHRLIIFTNSIHPTSHLGIITPWQDEMLRQHFLTGSDW